MMYDKNLKLKLTEKLNKYDFENEAYGCRYGNPEICKGFITENICVFIAKYNICKSPSNSWKNIMVS